MSDDKKVIFSMSDADKYSILKYLLFFMELKLEF